MPAYGWLYTDDLSLDKTSAKLSAMSKIGVPYSEEEISNAPAAATAQAKKIAEELVAQGAKNDSGIENKEIIAMIAYLQRLGTDIKGSPASTATSPGDTK